MRQEITNAIELFRKALELPDIQLLDPEHLETLDMVQERLHNTGHRHMEI